MGAKEFYVELEKGCRNIEGDNDAAGRYDYSPARLSEYPPPHGGKVFHKEELPYIDTGLKKLLGDI